MSRKEWIAPLQDLHVSISIDGPFVGWHEVTECYRNLGWNVRDHRIVQPSISGASIMEVQLDRPSGQYARLFFSCFEENGNGVKRDWSFAAGSRVANRLAYWIAWFSPAELKPTFQVQVLAVSDSPLSTEERAASLAFFEYTSRAITPKVVSSKETRE